MSKINFYNIPTTLPEYNSKYNGLFVMDSNNEFYVGTQNGWKKLSNDEIPVTSVNGQTGAVTLSIPDAQIQADWNQTTTTAKDYIKNKPNVNQTETGGTEVCNSNNNGSILIGSCGNISIHGNNYVELSDGSNYIGLEKTNDAGIIISANDGSDGTITLSASSDISINTTGTNKAYYNNKEIAVKDDIKVTSVNGQTGAVTVNVPVTSVNGQTGAVNLSIPANTSDLTNDSNFTTLSEVQTEIVGAAPEQLNTLAELSAALNDDQNFASTVTNLIGQKYTKPASGIPSTDLADGVIPESLSDLTDDVVAGNYLPLTGGTMSGTLTLSGAPILNLHAATKEYVDDSVFGGVVNESDSQYVKVDSIDNYNGQMLKVTIGSFSTLDEEMVPGLATVEDVESVISDNEIAISSALNQLNTRLETLEDNSSSGSGVTSVNGQTGAVNITAIQGINVHDTSLTPDANNIIDIGDYTFDDVIEIMGNDESQLDDIITPGIYKVIYKVTIASNRSIETVKTSILYVISQTGYNDGNPYTYLQQVEYFGDIRYRKQILNIKSITWSEWTTILVDNIITPSNIGNFEEEPAFNDSPAYSITSTDITNWNSAYTNGHTHSNKSVLDSISNADIAYWNNKLSTAPVTSVNGQTGAVSLTIPSEVTESTVSGWGFTKNTGTLTSETQLSKGTATGAGNAVTDINVSNHQITLVKGATYATQNDIDTSIAALVNSAPSTLDTLNELAAALGNDANFSTTVSTQIGNKISKVSNPTADNFASFNSDGTIKDSGHSHSDYITSIKTVNNESLVGSGNIVISGLPAVSSSDNGKILMVVNGQWQLVSPSVLYSGSGVPNNSNGNNGDIYIQTD